MSSSFNILEYVLSPSLLEYLKSAILLNDQFFILLTLYAISIIGIVLAIYIYYMRYKIRMYDTCIRELYDAYIYGIDIPKSNVVDNDVEEEKKV